MTTMQVLISVSSIINMQPDMWLLFGNALKDSCSGTGAMVHH